MLIKVDPLQYGYHEIINMETKASHMMMDIGIQKIAKGEGCSFFDDKKETAILLLDGEVCFRWGEKKEIAQRKSLFDENPVALHVPKNVEVVIDGISEAEILIEKTDNENTFDAVFYNQEQCKTEVFGENLWNDTAKRAVRTVFDYHNAPYSNLVLGEVINYPGKWSSYIPHGHEQPEVYYYRFQYPQGFGVGFIGDDAFKITNNCALCIPGGPTHPQAAAPGYAMWYCWMIRHLKDNPWTARVNDPRHEWLEEEHIKIWPEK